MKNLAKIKFGFQSINPYKSKYQIQMTHENKSDFLDFYIDEKLLENIKQKILNYNI